MNPLLSSCFDGVQEWNSVALTSTWGRLIWGLSSCQSLMKNLSRHIWEQLMEPRLSAVMPTQKEMKESSFFFFFFPYSNPGLFVCVLLTRLYQFVSDRCHDISEASTSSSYFHTFKVNQQTSRKKGRESVNQRQWTVGQLEIMMWATTPPAARALALLLPPLTVYSSLLSFTSFSSPSFCLLCSAPGVSFRSDLTCHQSTVIPPLQVTCPQSRMWVCVCRY